MCSNGSALEQYVNTFFLGELVKKESIDELVVVLNNRKVSRFQQICDSKSVSRLKGKLKKAKEEF